MIKPLPRDPTIRDVEHIIKTYFEDGWGFTVAQISYSIGCPAGGYSLGIKDVLDYLVGKKYPHLMHNTHFVTQILKTSGWRYAALTETQILEMKGSANADQARIVADGVGRSEEEQHQFKLDVARQCLETWCTLEGVAKNAFFEFRLLLIFMSDRDTQYQSIQNPFLYSFFYSFGLKIGDISADELHSAVPYPTREYLWRWIHFIVDPSLDSSLANNSVRGMSLMTRSSLEAHLKGAINKLIREDSALFESQGFSVPSDLLSLGKIIEGKGGVMIEGRLYWYFINILKDQSEVLPLGNEFRVGLINYCNSRGNDILQEEINVKRWEMELVMDYWMTEGSFYAADWVLSAIMQRKRTTVQRLIFSQGHRFPLDYRKRRDWTLPFDSE